MSKINVFFSAFNDEKAKKRIEKYFDNMANVIYSLKEADFAVFYCNEYMSSDLLLKTKSGSSFFPIGSTYENIYSNYRRNRLSKEKHMIVSYILARQKKIPCMFIGEYASIVGMLMNNIEHSFIQEYEEACYSSHFDIDGKKNYHDVSYKIDDTLKEQIWVYSNHNVIITKDLTNEFNNNYEVISQIPQRIVRNYVNKNLKLTSPNKQENDIASIYLPLHETMIVIDDCLNEDESFRDSCQEYFIDMFAILQDKVNKN